MNQRSSVLTAAPCSARPHSGIASGVGMSGWMQVAATPTRLLVSDAF
jgi:hypothetical protein